MSISLAIVLAGGAALGGVVWGGTACLMIGYWLGKNS